MGRNRLAGAPSPSGPAARVLSWAARGPVGSSDRTKKRARLRAWETAAERRTGMSGIEPRPAPRAVDGLAPHPRWARGDREERVFSNGMRQSTVWLVFRDWCGCNPILRIRLRQGHPDCRSISRRPQPVKADSRRGDRYECERRVFLILRASLTQPLHTFECSRATPDQLWRREFASSSPCNLALNLGCPLVGPPAQS